VVAVGGGSALDTAKAARMLHSNAVEADALANPLGMAMVAHPSLFVCVPTTAGTGSEVSESAIVAKSGTDYKMVLRSAEMAADVALLDPELGVSAPPEVTATAGYDAVTHAVEAFGSKLASPLTDPFALSAMRLLGANLERAYREPQALDARAACLVGAMQAGIAFNSAHLGLAHAIAGAMGALHHTPHGLANALALPWTTAFNEAALGDRAAVIADCFGGGSAALALSRLRHALRLDISLDAEVPDEAARDRLAEGAARSGQVKVNARLADPGQIRVIIEHMRRPTGGDTPHLNL
jgi:alcohol dehydrogenase class IV